MKTAERSVFRLYCVLELAVPKTKVKRMKFEKLFTENQDGSLTPIKIIQIGGVTFGPGVSIGPGVLFGGIDFFKIKGKDIATVHGTGGTVVIKGYYQTNR